MKLRTKIQLIFGVTVIVLLAILGTISCMLNYNTTTKQVNDSMTSSARLAADDISKQLKDYRNIVTAMGHNLAISTSCTDQERIASINEAVSYYGFTSGNILDLNGVSIKDGTDFSDREYVILAMAGTVNISDMTLSRYTGKYGVSIASPIYGSDGSIQGVVYFRIDDDFMTQILSSIEVSTNSYAYIIDDSGNVIAHDNTELVQQINVLDNENEALAKLAEDMVDGNTGTGSYSFEGNRLVCGYSAIDNADGWCLVIAAPENDFYEAMTHMIVLVIIFTVIAAVIALIISCLFAASISRSVIRSQQTLVALSKGQFENSLTETKRKDEIGSLQNATVSLCRTLSNIIGETNSALTAITNHSLVFDNIKEYPGDFNALAGSVNSIKKILGFLIEAIQQSSNEVANGSLQLSRAATDLSRGSTMQAESIQGLVDDVNSISAGIRQTSENGEVINTKLSNLDEEIKGSNEQMDGLVKAIQIVEEMSSDIKKIVSTIDSIAFQTNILALNASVEAARLGTDGKGFAVVAAEVGELAKKSADASTKTAELIEQCLRAIGHAKESADFTFDSLKKIVSNSSEISSAFQDISQAATHQADSANAIQNKIREISDVVQSNTATAQETAASTEELSAQAETMSGLINDFKI